MFRKAVIAIVLTAGILGAWTQQCIRGYDPRNLANWKLSPLDELLGAGGPDQYGYRWIDSDTIGGPTYNWIDITSIGTEVTGLADDNSVGPFSIGFDFPYYWYTVDKFWVCSNGVISFSSGNVWIPHDGGSLIPNPAQPNDVVAPLGGDLNFALGRGQVYYYTNNTDSLIVSFIDVPEWHYGSDTSGSHTFQLILYKGDSTITFQYGPQRGTFNYGYPGATPSCGIGIENVSGQIGLQYLYNNNPSQNMYEDSLAVLFYPPDTTTFQVTDISVFESGNKDNLGFFVAVGDTYNPYMIVKNSGNQDVANYTAYFKIKKIPGTYVYVDSTTGGPLAPGAMDTLFFSPWVPQEPLTCEVKSWVHLNGDMLPTNDSMKLDVRSVTGETWLTYLNDTTSVALMNWLGPGGGWGTRFTPPVYPCDIETIAVVLGMGQSGPADAVLMLMDDDGPNGLPGTVLLQDTVTVTDTAAWYLLLPRTGPITITDGSFYVGAIQLGNDGPAFGFDQMPPFSRQAMEFTGSWAPYRDREINDPAAKVFVHMEVDVAEMSSPVLVTTYRPRLLSLYPSITRKDINIAFSNPYAGRVSARLFDSSGRLVKSWNLGNLREGKFKRTLTVEGLQGVYFLQIENEKASSLAHKVILLR